MSQNNKERYLLRILGEPDLETLNHHLREIQRFRSPSNPRRDTQVPVYFDEILAQALFYNELNTKTFVFLQWMDYCPQYAAQVLVHEPQMIRHFFMSELKQSMIYLTIGLRLNGQVFEAGDSQAGRSPGFLVSHMRSLYMTL